MENVLIVSSEELRQLDVNWLFPSHVHKQWKFKRNVTAG